MRLYVGGTFDIFHPGHIRLLRRCKELGEVIVSLNTDEFTEQYKRRPIMTLEERAEVVGACRYVDAVIVNIGGADSRPAILSSDCTHIVHSDGWTGESLMKQMGLDEEWLSKHELELLYLPHTQGVSTTDLIERCRSQR